MPKVEPLDPEKRRQPTPAYIRFTKVARPKLKAENPELSNMCQISKLLGAKWKALSQAEKQVYHDEFHQENEEYKQYCKETGYVPVRRHKKEKRTKSKKEASKEKRTKSKKEASRSGNIDYHGNFQNLPSTAPSNLVQAMQAQQPWPTNMFPHMMPSLMGQQTIPPHPSNTCNYTWPFVYPTSSPLPAQHAHTPSSQTADSAHTIPNPNFDSNGNIAYAYPGANSRSSTVPYVVPTGIYTSKYYDEVVSNTPVSKLEDNLQTGAKSTPVSEPDVIQIVD